ncbi:MAG: type II toxin-antitoxin system VapC family toxin [Betaproteobacteria bacterium]|nr:type II toxin-antitoxin system VapC family toxin [Betaproteobacteria bacterium]
MIVLDTNVISELLKPVPEANVVTWIAAQPGTDLFTTTVTRGELLFGLYRMPEGQRRAILLQGLNRIFESRLPGRVLPYDETAADAYAQVAALRRSQGRPVSQSDAMIAGIVRSRGATLATRNVRDFQGCGIKVLDPWQ